MCFAPQRRTLFRHLNLQKWSEHGVFCTFWLGNVLRATMACTFSTSQLPKVVRTWCVLYILTWKCASRHNGVHFFRHRNFQKWSEPLVFCTFWLGNVLRATTAYTFSTSEPPKMVRTPSVLYMLTSKCASRHNGVHFFISHLASWLCTRRFSEPTFRPSGAPNHWKNIVFRDFPTFSRICIFFLLTLSLLIFSLLIFLFSLPLPCSAFHLSILSEVWLLNFLRPLHYITSHEIISIHLPTYLNNFYSILLQLFPSPLTHFHPFSRFPIGTFCAGSTARLRSRRTPVPLSASRWASAWERRSS